jgi:radical SAM superfamily enzyme YgiQ (UPF0313 family)
MLPSLYVAASMPSFVETRIIDEEIEPIDFETEADLVGVSFMTYNAPRAYEIAARFRLKQGKPVIFGGYHPTLMPDEAIQHADSICIGDAEKCMPRIVDDFMAGSLRRFYSNPCFELEGLPLPARNLLKPINYAPVDVVQATRGCPYRCSFCSVAAFHQYRFRTRPVREVIEEIKGLGPNILFMDDNIIGDPEYAAELFSRMIPLRKRWFSQSGIGMALDHELLGLASRSGCKGLFIGFESLSPQGLRGWNKHANVDVDYGLVVKNLHSSGIAIFAGFVFGGDTDTPDVFYATLRFLMESNVEALQATRLTPFPGTPLYAVLDRQGRIFDRDWLHYDFNHVVFEPLHMSRETLDRGVAFVLRQFHARTAIARRVMRGLGYLEPITALGGVLPINIGFRHRLRVDGNMARGADFEEANYGSPDERGQLLA